MLGIRFGGKIRALGVPIPHLLSAACAKSTGDLSGSATEIDATKRPVTVSFRDLDLSSTGDAVKLIERVDAAARRVCRIPVSNAYQDDLRRKCRRNAIAEAVGAVENAAVLVQLLNTYPWAKDHAPTGETAFAELRVDLTRTSSGAV